MRYFIILILITFIIAIINAEEINYVSDIIFKGNSTFSDDELSSIILLILVNYRFFLYKY